MIISNEKLGVCWARAGLLWVQRVQIIGAHPPGGAHKNPLLNKPEVKVSLYLLPFWRYKRFNMGIGAHTKILYQGPEFLGSALVGPTPKFFSGA